MYEGQTAKQWHDELVTARQDLANATRIAAERGNFVQGTLDRLGPLLGRPTKGDVAEADFYVDEAVKGWKYRQSMLDELQPLVKKLQAGEDVTQEEIDSLAKMADDLEQAIKNVKKG